MKYLGIDYGTKRIGLAISDESGMMAFPRGILDGAKQGQVALAEILDTIKAEDIHEIVIGKSLDTAGGRNLIMDDIDVFAEELHKLSGLPVHLHDERFSSFAARAFDFSKSDSNANHRKNHDRVEHIDDRAAAVMLQRYLDTK